MSGNPYALPPEARNTTRGGRRVSASGALSVCVDCRRYWSILTIFCPVCGARTEAFHIYERIQL